MHFVDGFTTLKGLSREIDVENPDKAYYRLQTERPMPIRWMAPETVSSMKFDTKSDVYSFGIFAFEVFSLGAFPFDDIDSDMKFLQDLVADAAGTSKKGGSSSSGEGGGPLSGMLMGQIKEALLVHSATLPPLVERLICECTAPDPAHRPSFAVLVQTTNPRVVASALVPPKRSAKNQLNALTPKDDIQRLRTDTIC
jgi:serine/threonine protein kinase